MIDPQLSDAAPPAAHRHQDSPVDLPPASGRDRRPLGWTTATIAVAALFLLLANAEALNAWAAEQTPSPTMLVVSDATEGWLAVTRRLHMAAPRAAAHDAWQAAQRARFTGQPAAELE